jgi:hypothetical protein
MLFATVRHQTNYIGKTVNKKRTLCCCCCYCNITIFSNIVVYCLGACRFGRVNTLQQCAWPGVSTANEAGWYIWLCGGINSDLLKIKFVEIYSYAYQLEVKSVIFYSYCALINTVSSLFICVYGYIISRDNL